MKVDTLQVPALTEQPKFFCTQKQERDQTAPYHDKWLLTRGVITLMSCKPFSNARMSLLCFQVVRFRDNGRTLL